MNSCCFVTSTASTQQMSQSQGQTRVVFQMMSIFLPFFPESSCRALSCISLSPEKQKGPAPLIRGAEPYNQLFSVFWRTEELFSRQYLQNESILSLRARWCQGFGTGLILRKALVLISRSISCVSYHFHRDKAHSCQLFGERESRMYSVRRTA